MTTTLGPDWKGGIAIYCDFLRFFVSCFQAGYPVRMFTKDKGAPEYKRMDKLVKRDQLWTRRYKRNILGPSQGHVECVMTFACPLKGQPMVEVEGNFLTPEHYVARGNGTWSTAGELTPPGLESAIQLASIVYNIKLQEGNYIELGNRIYAATLGARFDTAGPEEEPTYSEEDSNISKTYRGVPRDISTGPRGLPQWIVTGCPAPNGQQNLPQE